ncbi:MAG: hypothetical protein LKK19_07450, partial [Bacteroidales bacterium]|nr:hypothetical protein [Bacteroidales bacterium]
MKINYLTMALAITALIPASCSAVGTGGVPVTGGRDIYSGLPFRMDSVREPSIPPRTVSITDFGGV